MIEELTQRLIEKQKQERLNNREFAERLGVQECQWYRIKNGSRAPGRKVLGNVMELYPALKTLAMKILTRE